MTSLSGTLPADEFEVSIKRKPKGAVSTFLHDNYQAGGAIEKEMSVEVAGVGGDFTAFATDPV